MQGVGQGFESLYLHRMSGSEGLTGQTGGSRVDKRKTNDSKTGTTAFGKHERGGNNRSEIVENGSTALRDVCREQPGRNAGLFLSVVMVEVASNRQMQIKR